MYISRLNSDAASKYDVDALIVENTFLSLVSLINYQPKLMPTVMPFLRHFTFLCHQQWDSFSLLPSVDSNILMLSGRKDQLIPAKHMDSLYELAEKRGKGKTVMVKFSDGDHNDTCLQAGYFESIKKFLNEHV
jgi:fermentation-respiration switch protein FrsA (DUF1100 family)